MLSDSSITSSSLSLESQKMNKRSNKQVVSDEDKLAYIMEDNGKGSLFEAFAQALQWTLLNIIEMHFKRDRYVSLFNELFLNGKDRDNAEAKFSDWLWIDSILLRRLAKSNPIINGMRCSVVKIIEHLLNDDNIYGLIRIGKKDLRYKKSGKSFNRTSFWLLDPEVMDRLPCAKDLRKNLCINAQKLIAEQAFPWTIEHFKSCKKSREAAVSRK